MDDQPVRPDPHDTMAPPVANSIYSDVNKILVRLTRLEQRMHRAETQIRDDAETLRKLKAGDPQ